MIGVFSPTKGLVQVASKSMYDSVIELLGKLWLSDELLATAIGYLDAMAPVDPKTLLLASRGVTPQVRENLLRLVQQGFKVPFLNRFLELADECLERDNTQTEQLYSDLDEYARAMKGGGVRYLVVKGASLQSVYPPGSVRTMDDVDLLVEEGGAWPSIGTFAEIGYQPKRIRLERVSGWAREGGRQRIGAFGIAELTSEPETGWCGFDLHMGCFPGCGESTINSDIWSRSTSVQVGRTRVYAPALEDCVLIVCVHIGRHGFARLRDINDVHACLVKAGDKFDWAYLRHNASRSGVELILLGLLERLRVRYGVRLPLHELARLRCGWFSKPLSESIFERARRNPKYRDERQVLRGRFIQTFVLYRYYRHRRPLYAALWEAALGAYYLFQSGRPHPIWSGRVVWRLQSADRVVIVPVQPIRYDGARQDVRYISIPKAQEFAASVGIATESLGHEMLVCNPGSKLELVLTPSGVYTQSAYNGSVESGIMKDVQNQAYMLTSSLLERGIARDTWAPGRERAR
jgi:hypothetical protein